MSFAIFEPGNGRAFYKLYAKLPATDADLGDERFQMLKRHIYRGPQLVQLLPTFNLRPYNINRRALLAIDVPGLPEVCHLFWPHYGR